MRPLEVVAEGRRSGRMVPAISSMGEESGVWVPLLTVRGCFSVSGFSGGTEF